MDGCGWRSLICDGILLSTPAVVDRLQPVRARPHRAAVGQSAAADADQRLPAAALARGAPAQLGGGAVRGDGAGQTSGRRGGGCVRGAQRGLGRGEPRIAACSGRCCSTRTWRCRSGSSWSSLPSDPWRWEKQGGGSAPRPRQRAEPLKSGCFPVISPELQLTLKNMVSKGLRPLAGPRQSPGLTSAPLPRPPPAGSIGRAGILADQAVVVGAAPWCLAAAAQLRDHARQHLRQFRQQSPRLHAGLARHRLDLVRAQHRMQLVRRDGMIVAVANQDCAIWPSPCCSNADIRPCSAPPGAAPAPVPCRGNRPPPSSVAARLPSALPPGPGPGHPAPPPSGPAAAKRPAGRHPIVRPKDP